MDAATAGARRDSGPLRRDRWDARLGPANPSSIIAQLPPCLVGIEACASAHHWSRQVDPAIRTTQLPPSIVECGLSIGT